MKNTHIDYSNGLNAAICDKPPEISQAEQEKLIQLNKIFLECQNYLCSDDMDPEHLCGYFDDLYYQVQKTGEFDPLFEFVSILKREHFDIYKEEGQYFLNACINAKLWQEEIPEACDDFIEFCHLFGLSLELFFPLMHQLLYYGQHDTVLEGIKVIWPDIIELAKNSPDYIDNKGWLQWYYCQLLSFHKYLEMDGIITKDDLMPQIAFLDFEDKNIQKRHLDFLDLLTTQKPVALNQIETDMPTLLKNNQLSDIAYNVIDTFIRYLLNNEDIPQEMVYIHWRQTCNYIIARLNGTLGIRPKKIAHAFCPESKTMHHYIKREFITFGNIFHPHESIVFLRAIILWVKFLAEHHLIDDLSTTFKEISNVYVTHKNHIQPRFFSPHIKEESQSLLTTVKTLINER